MKQKKSNVLFLHENCVAALVISDNVVWR